MNPYVNQIIGVFKDAENEYNEVKLFTDIDLDKSNSKIL